MLAVPSLYVRVYRYRDAKNNETQRSLIICEGISYKEIDHVNILTFPHYM